MYLSKEVPSLLKKYYIYEIKNEKEIDGLGLLQMNLQFPFLSFLEDIKFVKNINKNAKMIITKPEFLDLIPNGVGVYLSTYPRLSFFKIHNYFSQLDRYKIREDFETIFGKNCNISKLASISNKNVKIGNNVIIEEFVSIKENTIIGDNCIIRSGAIIGGEGFEFKKVPNGSSLGVKHCGWVIIKNNVEIQNNSCVDKALYPWDITLLSDNCKIDNFVHIAHGVKLMDSVFIAAGVSTGGRTVFGKNTWVGVGATVSNALIIGENARINIGAVVTKNVEENQSVSGNFAISHKKFIQFIKSIR